MIGFKYRESFDIELYWKLYKFIFCELQSNMKTNITDNFTFDLWKQLQGELNAELADEIEYPESISR